MPGIDIHPYYQRTVTSWSAIADFADWVYVKASDGLANYTKQVGGVTYRPDTHVANAKRVGLPVGAYHYAQFGDPVAQANVAMAQSDRLGCNLPMMLDLEAPFTGDANAASFAQRFLNRVRAVGRRPVLYCSSSHAKAMRPDQWGVPNLVIWIASYGANNGVQNPLTGGYPGRVDIHQYTSTGRVPGISGDVDLNRDYVGLNQIGGTTEVALKDEIFEFRAPDGRLLKVDALTALANLYAERFYGSSTAPWTGPSGRAIDLGEADEVPSAISLTPENIAELTNQLEAAGVGGASPDQVEEALRSVLRQGVGSAAEEGS